MFLCADRYNEILLRSNPPTQLPAKLRNGKISRKMYTIFSHFPSFLFSWVQKFIWKSVGFIRWFRFHVVSVQFYFVLSVTIISEKSLSEEFFFVFRIIFSFEVKVDENFPELNYCLNIKVCSLGLLFTLWRTCSFLCMNNAWEIFVSFHCVNQVKGHWG